MAVNGCAAGVFSCKHVTCYVCVLSTCLGSKVKGSSINYGNAKLSTSKAYYWRSNRTVNFLLELYKSLVTDRDTNAADINTVTSDTVRQVLYQVAIGI